MTAGDLNTVINVTGGQFLPNEETTLYWDQPNKVAGAAKADGGGSFNTRVKAFSGDAPGTHKLCASVPPSPCATFSLAGPQASPSASPSPSESPSPSAVPTTDVTPTSSPVAATLNGFQVITTPPFVFLPIAGIDLPREQVLPYFPGGAGGPGSDKPAEDKPKEEKKEEKKEETKEDTKEGTKVTPQFFGD